MHVTQSVIPAHAGFSPFESVRLPHETPASAGVTRSC